MSATLEVRLTSPPKRSRQECMGCRAAKICWRYLMDPFDTSPYGECPFTNLPGFVRLPESWTESMRQIGNAVPVLLGEAIAEKLKATLTRN